MAGVVTKATNELIGSCTICYEKDRDIWSMGYTFRKDTWGHGYATEAMQGLIDYIKKFRTMRGIEGCVVNENPESQRVLEKSGMTFLKDVTLSKIDGTQTFKGKKFRKIF
ncbi:MAG: GNAT family N-acetyltransferase [Bdellovibrionota bacterium]|nr:GNAT family N-acetyltransferase [Pseudomonadota bacterium]MDY6090173.1 GNAT family N-acetyltransferase [Bdellovibrionota bacterium]